jgi:hypothetical protein
VTDTSRLGAIVGGKTLSKDEARALWQRFSEYMDANRNDFAGFAKREGFAFASVAAHAGVATLTLSNEQPSSAPRGPGRGGATKGGGPSRKRR